MIGSDYLDDEGAGNESQNATNRSEFSCLYAILDKKIKNICIRAWLKYKKINLFSA